MDPRRSPQRIRGGHLAHQRANGSIGPWAARAKPRRPSRPSPAEPFARPPHHSVGSDEHERRAPVPPRLGQHDPKQPISLSELWMADRACQRVELLPECEVLEDQFVMSAASHGQRSRHQHDSFEHVSSSPAGPAKINRHTGPDAVLARDTIADSRARAAVTALASHVASAADRRDARTSNAS
jgi:hypothetical protein